MSSKDTYRRMTVVVKDIQIQQIQDPKGQSRQDKKDVPIKPLKTPKTRRGKIRGRFTPPPGNLIVPKTLDKGRKEGLSMGSTVMVYTTFCFPPTPCTSPKRVTTKKTDQDKTGTDTNRQIWTHNNRHTDRDRQPNRQTERDRHSRTNTYSPSDWSWIAKRRVSPRRPVRFLPCSACAWAGRCSTEGRLSSMDRLPR